MTKIKITIELDAIVDIHELDPLTTDQDIAAAVDRFRSLLARTFVAGAESTTTTNHAYFILTLTQASPPNIDAILELLEAQSVMEIERL